MKTQDPVILELIKNICSIFVRLENKRMNYEAAGVEVLSLLDSYNQQEIDEIALQIFNLTTEGLNGLGLEIIEEELDFFHVFVEETLSPDVQVETTLGSFIQYDGFGNEWYPEGLIASNVSTLGRLAWHHQRLRLY